MYASDNTFRFNGLHTVVTLSPACQGKGRTKLSVSLRCTENARRRMDVYMSWNFSTLPRTSCGSATASIPLVSSTTSAETHSDLSAEPSSSSTPTPARPSTHTSVIIGSVLGGVTFICTLFLLAIFFLRRGYFIRRHSDRRSQIPDPFRQGKVGDSTDPMLSPELPTVDTPSGAQDIRDRVEVRDEGERLEQLESTVQLLLSEWQRCNGSDIQEPPPDYVSSN
ncbi:uncharacterized protein ARMOST_21708 [Armillaria ostoyae]|uniref:Uncharacterized protein n=1 Tax=Armillaria ostoyae TaxID=47428 RepID=A0A284SAY0_ARMOS|nr:uncharacterized protein ARMOST_21708 [Armillaria ostoyae]